MLKNLDRKSVDTSEEFPVKILQFGEGNFLRAFVDWIIDNLNEKADFNAGVKVIQPISKGMAHVLEEQDGLYHVILQGISKGETVSEIRLIKSVNGAINPYDNYEDFLRLAENPYLKFIISNTTEAGIAFDENDVSLKELPNSYPGKLTALLFHRFEYFQGNSNTKLTIIPCELIDKNGEKLRDIVLRYAKLWDLDDRFIKWINEDITFCNSLVDRIVPGYPSEKADEIRQKIGYNDQLLVSAEYFHLWVIEAPKHVESLFPVKRANLNVKFVEDLTPYRTRKVRILNGIHTTMVPVGYLSGLTTVKETINDNLIGPFLQDALFKEIIPTLDLPEEELKSFANDVLDRFRNPFIKHNLISIALNSISKYKVRVLPSVLEYVDRYNKLPNRLLYSLAALIRFYKGGWNGNPIPLNDSDDVIDFFNNIWKANDYSKIADQVLSNKDFWGQDLTKIDEFKNKIATYLQKIVRDGIDESISNIKF